MNVNIIDLAIKHFNISVKGKVQGVYFRANAQKQAIALNIKGFVKNRSDGSVYLEVEGEEESLKQLVIWCHRGPERAKVEEVKVEEREMTSFTSFEIRH